MWCATTQAPVNWITHDKQNVLAESRIIPRPETQTLTTLSVFPAGTIASALRHELIRASQFVRPNSLQRAIRARFQKSRSIRMEAARRHEAQARGISRVSVFFVLSLFSEHFTCGRVHRGA
jgi:hypothetical protein